MEFKVLNIWKQRYDQHVQNRLITLNEGLTMISNELGINKQIIQQVIKSIH
ncbi:MAG: hypothetical protein U9Q33_04205 [Campylobacterota bacterium]|nr:hypothetical protein [Campylobacterota bacterium]